MLKGAQFITIHIFSGSFVTIFNPEQTRKVSSVATCHTVLTSCSPGDDQARVGLNRLEDERLLAWPLRVGVTRTEKCVADMGDQKTQTSEDLSSTSMCAPRPLRLASPHTQCSWPLRPWMLKVVAQLPMFCAPQWCFQCRCHLGIQIEGVEDIGWFRT